MAVPSIVSLKAFLKAKPFPKRPPIVFLPKADRATFLGKAKTVKFEDFTRLVPKGAPVVELTPYPGGDVIRQMCWSTNTNIACVPEVRIGPFGVEFVACRCFQVGMDGDDPPTVVIPPPPLKICRLRIGTDGALSCAGLCIGGGTCRLAKAPKPGGGFMVTCICRLTSS